MTTEPRTIGLFDGREVVVGLRHGRAAAPPGHGRPDGGQGDRDPQDPQLLARGPGEQQGPGRR